MPAEERKKQILDSARKVFSSSGLKGARTRELAQAAGINQSTLFEHFKSKEELFMAAVMQPLSEQLENIRERVQAYESADSPSSLHTLLSTGIQRNLESMVDIFPLLAQALLSDQELGRRFYHEQIRPLIETRADTMFSLTKSSLDPELLQVAFFGMFFSVAMDQAFTGNKRDLNDVARQITELITGGCAPQQFTE
jgi:AcrR family transcriptional regulator